MKYYFCKILKLSREHKQIKLNKFYQKYFQIYLFLSPDETKTFRCCQNKQRTLKMFDRLIGTDSNSTIHSIDEHLSDQHISTLWGIHDRLDRLRGERFKLFKLKYCLKFKL